MSEVFSSIKNVPYTSPVNSQPLEPAKVQVQQAVPATNVAQEDKVEISNKKPEKKGLIKTVKGGIANIKKFFASTGAYIQGTAKGIGQGAVAGSLVFTGGSIVNAIKAKKAGTETFKKIPNKALAVVVAGVALAANLWTASLNATERSSEIDHRWTGHKE